MASWKKKTMYWSPKHWIYFKPIMSVLCLSFFLSFQFKFSVHYCILIKLCCLIARSKYQSLFLAVFEVKCAWYLHSLHIHFLISLFPVALHKCHLNITMLCLYCFTRSTDLISIFCAMYHVLQPYGSCTICNYLPWTPDNSNLFRFIVLIIITSYWWCLTQVRRMVSVLKSPRPYSAKKSFNHKIND